MIDFKDFSSDCHHKNELQELVNCSNLALKNWQIYWTNFISYFTYEEISEELNKLSDLSYFAYGGYDNSERVKIACFRKTFDPNVEDLIKIFPGKGIEIRGNFLFDNASQSDFREFLEEIGFLSCDIGDIWTTGDRGSQGIVTDLEEEIISAKTHFLRNVEVNIKTIDLKSLKTPIKRIEKIINTVEASTRLDAIASAGFRISRSKIRERIETGLIRLNGIKILKSTVNLKIGDKLRMENKGLIEIINIQKTKRERWKIKLIKK